MTGRETTLIPPTTYDLSNMKQVAGSNVLFTIARLIDLSPYETATIALRVHTATIAGSADNLEIDVFPDAFSLDDTSAGLDSAGLSLLVAPLVITTSPDYQVAQLNAPFGGLVRVVLEGTRGTPPGTTMTARISVDMFGKTGGAIKGAHVRTAETFRGYLPPPLWSEGRPAPDSTSSAGTADDSNPFLERPADIDHLRIPEPRLRQATRTVFGRTFWR